MEQRISRGAKRSNHWSVKPHFSSVPSRKLSMSTSARSMRAAGIFCPAGAARLAVTDRLVLFAASHADKISGLLPCEGRPPAAGIVAFPRRLDLDDIGAHVPEHHGAEWTREDAREIDDANCGQRAGCGRCGVYRCLRHFDFLRMEGGALRSLAQPSRYSSSSRLLRMRNF